MEERVIKLQKIFEGNTDLLKEMLALETAEEVQGFLKDRGLEFSLEEIDAFKTALVKALERGSDELSDEELENVAGGMAFAAVSAVIGLVASIGYAAYDLTRRRTRW